MIAVTGTVRFAPGEIERLQSVFAAMITATRAEDGCLRYTYGRDVMEQDTLIISELWRDDAVLDTHFKTPHMHTLMAALEASKVLSLSVKRHDISNTAQLMGAD